MRFKTISGYMESLTIFLLLKGCDVTPNQRFPRLYQTSVSPIPHAEPYSSLKKSTALRYVGDNGLMWLKIGRVTPISSTPQQKVDERGVKKSSTQPEPRTRVPRPSTMGLEREPGVLKKTARSNSGSRIRPKRRESREKIEDRGSRAETRSVFPISMSHKSGNKTLYWPSRSYVNIENGKEDRATNVKKTKTSRDIKENRPVGLGDLPSDEQGIRSARRSAIYAKDGIGFASERTMLQGLVNQFSPAFGTKEEKLDEENTMSKIETLNELSKTAPRDFNLLNMKENKLGDLDVSIGEMEPWQHIGYNGVSLQRSRVPRKYKRESNTPFLLHDRKVRRALPEYFEPDFPKIPKIKRLPTFLPFRVAPPIKRFQERPTIADSEEHEIFPPDEYAANPEPAVPLEGQIIDEPQPAPEPVPEPEPAPIPELPSIKEIPPIREPDAPKSPNLDPKKTFDSGESNGGEKETIPTNSTETSNVTP